MPPPLTIPTLSPSDGMSPEEWAALWASLPHDSMAMLPISVAIVCIILASLAVSLRLYTRRFIMRGEVGIDDVFAIVSLVFVYVNCAISIASTYSGLGTHGWDLPGPETIVTFFKLLYATQLLYHANLLFIKLTLLFQYYRLVYLIDEYKIPYMAIMAISVLWALISICLLAFSCNPVAAFWDKTIPNFTCNFTTGLVASVGNIVTDFVILLLPIPVVLQLNMGTAQKVACLGIFAVGSFACVVSILRLVLLPSATDVTYTAAVTASWTMAELTAGLICPCLMTLRPFLRRVAPFLGLSCGASTERTGRTGQSRFGRPEGYKLQSASSRPPRQQPTSTNFEGSSEEELTLHDMFGTSRATIHVSQGGKSAPSEARNPDPDLVSPVSIPTSPFLPPSTSPLAAYGPPLAHSPALVEQHSGRRESFQLDKLCLTPGVRCEISAGPSREDLVERGDAVDEESNHESRSDPRKQPSLGIHIKRAWSVQKNAKSRPVRGGGQQDH
ncbi:Satratoxin biosynthesis SC1 cluster protein 4 [Apiospora arundinis]